MLTLRLSSVVSRSFWLILYMLFRHKVLYTVRFGEQPVSPTSKFLYCANNLFFECSMEREVDVIWYKNINYTIIIISHYDELDSDYLLQAQHPLKIYFNFNTRKRIWVSQKYEKTMFVVNCIKKHEHKSSYTTRNILAFSRITFGCFWSCFIVLTFPNL